VRISALWGIFANKGLKLSGLAEMFLTISQKKTYTKRKPVKNLLLEKKPFC